MQNTAIAALAACIGLGVPAAATAAGLFSATRTVIAILADDLFVGEAEGHLNGAGTLAIRSQRNPAVSCLGQFTSSAELGGTGQMLCSDGSTATFHFQRLDMFRGHGAGASSSRGSMSFAYGLSVEEAGRYLKLPQGKKLTHNGTELAMVDL
jgi:hypothetical protein